MNIARFSVTSAYFPDPLNMDEAARIPKHTVETSCGMETENRTKTVNLEAIFDWVNDQFLNYKFIFHYDCYHIAFFKPTRSHVPPRIIIVKNVGIGCQVTE